MKVGHDFDGWYLGDEEYVFTTPVTGDITLTAAWKRSEYTVTFKSENTAVDTQTVLYEDKAVRPQNNPTRNGYVFDGWYIGGEKYDFSSPVTGDTEITAKWLDERETTLSMRDALEKDYTNYTSNRTVTEVEDDTSISYTISYKRTADAAYCISAPVSVIDPERYIVYDGDGRTLAGYYVNNGEWKKSDLVSFDTIIPAMKMSEISADSFLYIEGRYHVYDEDIASVEYALFRTSGTYTSLYFELSGGCVAKIGGEIPSSLSTSTITFTQNLSDFGTTQIQKPSGLPAVTVEITTKDKEVTEGEAINAADVTSLFTVKADGRTVTVTNDMIDLGGLDLDNPAVDTYTVTCTYVSWDGVSHSETATVTVKAKQATTEGFAAIFAKDYTNATITYNSTTYIRNGNLYEWNLGVWDYAAVVQENSASYLCAKYKKADTTSAPSKFTSAKLPRLDMVFALDAALFADNGDGTCTLSSSVDMDSALATALTNIFKGNELASAKIVADDIENYPFSVTLTVNGDFVSKIEYSYYVNSFNKITLKTCSIELSAVGTSATIDVRDDVRAIIYPA